ncbi:MAG: MiaB/RimO family radical SAM methylthiotransferase, partial [Chloroflexota bacterium]|nr:MiaB/RimO family radical SAM methylthiotransferase [Chloroflexota bacterium]
VCAYCIVPKVRGRERSILPEEIVSNISELADEGYKEVVLTGTQLGSYGFDLSGMDLTGLLRRILGETTIERIRVSSLQPYDISPDLVDLWSNPRMCPHFHMPLQSGSDKILKSMRRRYTSQEYLSAIKYVRSTVANVSVTADVIVGFPGECDDDFEQTISLCNAIQFASLHVFPYSARPGTSATYLDDHVSADLKSVRTDELIAISQMHHEKFISSIIGQVRPVLWEESKEDKGVTEWVGLTDNYVRVKTVSEENLANQIIASRILLKSKDTVMTELAELTV